MDVGNASPTFCVSGDAIINWKDPGGEGTLQMSVLMDSTHLER
jgi:hypothetical protein